MAKRPNLIYLMADQLRLQSCGYAGDPVAITPHIDALASEGVNFTNAVSGTPVCAAYRASLMTGKYASSTGMVINEIRLNPNHHRCLGQVLTDGGYDTAYIGKWHLWANELGNHDDPKNAHIPRGPHRLGFDGFWAAYNFHHHYVDAYYHADDGERVTIEGYEPDGQTDLAITQLERLAQQEQPFALFLSYGTPHDPWDLDNVPAEDYSLFADVALPDPPNYLPGNDEHADDWAVLSDDEREQLQQWRRIYYAMTHNLDTNVGRVLAAVERLGLAEETIIVFTSDHGEMFGAQGRRAKNIFYEEAVRVPFLVRWPGQIDAASQTEAALNSPDIMPTLLGMLDLEIPDAVEGTDLSGCARGGPAPVPNTAFMQGMGTTAAWVDGHEWRALRGPRYTYACYLADGMELLHDRVEDPYEMTNLALAPAYGEMLRDYRMLLVGRMARLNDQFQPCTWYRDHWTEDRLIVETATCERMAQPE